MKVFEESWVKALEEQYHSTSKYTTPFIARLALDPVLSLERAKIENWFQTLPKDVKPDILGRLRDTSNSQHFSAYYELVLYQFFKSMDYSVTIHPKLPEGEPDLLVTGGNLDKPIVIEVAIVFDEPSWQKEEQKFSLILEQLDKIKHYFFVMVSVHSEHIPERVDYKKLKQFVTNWLDSFDPKITHTTQETRYQADGLNLKLTLLPKKTLEKAPIVMSHSLPVRWVGTDQLRKMIANKVNKYKSVKERGLHFIIALNIDNMPAGERGLLDTLISKPVVYIRSNKNGDVVNVQEGRDYSGLLIPKPGLGGMAENTRLSAVINVASKWLEGEENEPARRIHYFRVIHNPCASIPLDHEVFKGYPQFIVISENQSENQKEVSLGWVGEDAEKPFDC